MNISLNKVLGQISTEKLLNGVKMRVKSAIYAPVEIIRQSVFGLGGAFFGLAGTGLSVATGGLSSKVNYLADCIDFKGPDISTHRTFSGIYAAAMDILQPGERARIHEKLDEHEMGVVRTVAQKVFDKADKLSHKESYTKRYAASRGLYLLGGVAAVAARTLDLAIGLWAAGYSFTLLGSDKELNHFAARNLTFTGIPSDVYRAARGFVNPQQFHKKDKVVVENEFDKDIWDEPIILPSVVDVDEEPSVSDSRRGSVYSECSSISESDIDYQTLDDLMGL